MLLAYYISNILKIDHNFLIRQGSTLTVTNCFLYLPFGQVKLSLSDFYLPERKIYLPENEI